MAYGAAGVKYPERQITSGVVSPEVIKRCINYEKRIIGILADLGKVKSKVRINMGIVDCLFILNGKKYMVEIKDFNGKNNITMYEMKQLYRYMQSLDCRRGLLVCPKSSFPKRKNGRKVQKDNNLILILSDEDLKNGAAGIFKS